LERNRRLFVEKWGARLNEFAPPQPDSPAAIEQAMARAETFARFCSLHQSSPAVSTPVQHSAQLIDESLYLEKALKVQREYAEHLNRNLDEALVDRDRWQVRCVAREAELTALRMQVQRTADSGSGQVDADLKFTQESYDICNEPFSSHRKYLGRFTIALMKFARLLLIQVFSRQVRYNAASARLLAHLERGVRTLKAELAKKD
jgi:hypothetical protein